MQEGLGAPALGHCFFHPETQLLGQPLGFGG
jgi:hypothetical protein